jgi:GntR family transcriptional regulator
MARRGPDDLRWEANTALQQALATAEQQADPLTGYELATLIGRDVAGQTSAVGDARGYLLMRAQNELGLSLAELGRRVGLTKATVQQTIRKAREHGHQPGEPARGTRSVHLAPLVRFRSIPPHGMGTGSSFDEQVRKQGREPSAPLLRAEMISPPTRAAAYLDLAPGEQVLVRERHMLADGQPIQLAAAYYPASIAGGPELAYPDAGPATIYQRLAKRGHRVTRVDETIAARRAAPDEAEALGITTSHLVLEVLRLAQDDSGRVREVTFNVFPADSWRLDYQWREDDA